VLVVDVDLNQAPKRTFKAHACQTVIFAVANTKVRSVLENSQFTSHIVGYANKKLKPISKTKKPIRASTATPISFMLSFSPKLR
jgi:hypothetical protein